MKRLKIWEPNRSEFWEETGKKIANRNLIISAIALHLSFCVWQVWSVMTLNLPKVGFTYTTNQMFTLAALPALTGAILRLVYSVVVAYVGGRLWTVISTSLLLIPIIGIGLAIQDPNTPFLTMAILSALCGLGGANFASSMANIGPFFPEKKQGSALGINGGLGNLGVSTVQFITPIVITFPLFNGILGRPQTSVTAGKASDVWLQNGALIWVVPLTIVIIFAYFFMNSLPRPKLSLVEQTQVFRNKHMYLITILYIMSFGSFIGYSAAFPLLLMNQFPNVDALQLAFIGPLLSAFFRMIGGFLADKFGGAVISLLSVLVMIGATAGVVFSIGQTKNFLIFFSMFMVLFVTGGIVNGSLFRMIPLIFGPNDSPAAIGFSSAIGAFGGFFIPKMFGFSIELTGTAQIALYVFMGFYFLCAVILWKYYAGPNAELKS